MKENKKSAHDIQEHLDATDALYNHLQNCIYAFFTLSSMGYTLKLWIITFTNYQVCKCKKIHLALFHIFILRQTKSAKLWFLR